MVLWDSNSMMAFWGYTFGVCFEAANHPPQKKRVLGESEDGQGPPILRPWLLQGATIECRRAA